MSLREDIDSDISEILAFKWDTREGKVVPKPEDVALLGGGVDLEAVMLYADLLDSTSLVTHNRKTAARVFKAFLSLTARIIRAHDGEIRSFDGDRIMGVFIEGPKNTNAATSALKINWGVRNLLIPALKKQYDAFNNGTLTLKQVVGVDRSDVLVVRGGIVKNNDLVWIGKAPQFAAKLSSLRETPQYSSYISEAVYSVMLDDAKLSDQGTNMWEERSWRGETIYRSDFTWVIR